MKYNMDSIAGVLHHHKVKYTGQCLMSDLQTPSKGLFKQYSPVIGPLGCLGGCQLRLTALGLSSTGTTVKSRGWLDGAASWVMFNTTMLHGLSRRPCTWITDYTNASQVLQLLHSMFMSLTLTTLTVNSYWVFGFRSSIMQLRSVALKYL